MICNTNLPEMRVDPILSSEDSSRMSLRSSKPTDRNDAVLRPPGDEDRGKDRDRDGDHNADDGGENEPPLTATPFLLIPSGARDTGARPIPAAQAVNNNSIQLKLVNPKVSTGWTDFEFQLSCIVANLGVMGCIAGLAEFYVGDEFSESLNPIHDPEKVKANAQLIGYASFQVPSGGTTTVKCKNMWKPGSSKAAQKGVLVQIYDFFTDRMTAPFDAVYDRHVARNDQASNSIIVSQGTATIKAFFDLDAGVHSGTGDVLSGADIAYIWWHPNASMTPENGASIINLGAVDFNSLTAADLQKRAYTTIPIKVVKGDVFAVLTTNGNYAKVLCVDIRAGVPIVDPITTVLVVTYGYGMVIQWVTYAPPP